MVCKENFTSFCNELSFKLGSEDQESFYLICKHILRCIMKHVIKKSPRSSSSQPSHAGRVVDLGAGEPLEAGNEPGSPGLRGLAAAARGAAFRALGGSTTPRKPHRILQQDVPPGAGGCLRPPGVPYLKSRREQSGIAV